MKISDFRFPIFTALAICILQFAICNSFSAPAPVFEIRVNANGDVISSTLPSNHVVNFPSGTTLKINGITVSAGAGNVGMVSAVEAYVNHNVAVGSLPVIDGYQTLENNRVFLGAQSNPIQNGIWIVHAGSAWTRPGDFANGMTLQSGQLIFASRGDNEVQFGGVWIQCDNAANDQIPFIVGTDPINSLSIKRDTAIPPVGFPNVPQGPFIDMSFFGRTSAASELGLGAQLWNPDGQVTGVDANATPLVNLPNPTNAQDAATKSYVDGALSDLDLSAADIDVASIHSVGGELTVHVSSSGYYGPGSNLTDLDASQLTIGVVPVAAIPYLDASILSSGSLAPGRMANPVIALPAVPSTTLNAAAANQFIITPTNGNAFAISFLNPTNGQTATVTIRNTFGTLGVITWTGFKLAAWTQPANGFSRSITFNYNGSNWVEVSRVAADVPN